MKYLVLAPFVAHSIYTYFMSKDESQRDLVYIIILPLLLSRVIHNQIWISLSRYRTAKGNNRILDRSIEFDQVDRESNWYELFTLTLSLFARYIVVSANILTIVLINSYLHLVLTPN